MRSHHPPTKIDVDSHIQQLKSSPTVTIVSEGEIVLQTGLIGKRFVVDSMGRSISLVTEINSRTVVLTCFGEPEQFDEIAITLSGIEVASPPGCYPVSVRFYQSRNS